MSIADYLILGILLLWLFFSLRFLFAKRKQGMCIGCSGGTCASCAKNQNQKIDSKNDFLKG
jgi:hypothetical protein